LELGACNPGWSKKEGSFARMVEPLPCPRSILLTRRI
jgi:hypothetical protein